jgi:nucleoside-diphosphate-sugar epimerase
MAEHALVTGAAGFIGSHLVDRLLADGWTVTALDALTDYYDESQKRRNLAGWEDHPGCRAVLDDLRTADLADLLDGVDVVFHQAGQPGVRASWERFGSYVEHNVKATEQLLQACAGAAPRRFVYASSSSVYGDAERFPTTEDDLPAPRSPYGVTKLAAEHLCGVFAADHGLPTVALRYFTVFGPRQRPDMAMHRMVEAALEDTPFPLYGDGSAVRDFTYVGDVVEANLAAASAEVAPGTVVNISGGTDASMRLVIDTVGRLVGREITLDVQPAAAGDVHRTGGSPERARALLGWSPQVGLDDGLARQVDWHRSRRAARTG